MPDANNGFLILIMTKIKVRFPGKYIFGCEVPIRITDLNYGGHVGNDSMFAIIQEARVQFLGSFGYGELAFEGLGLIMANATIEFRNELFHGDITRVEVGIFEITNISFDLYYHLSTKKKDKFTSIAEARTGMVCYDYKAKKIASIPQGARAKLTAFAEKQSWNE